MGLLGDRGNRTFLLVLAALMAAVLMAAIALGVSDMETFVAGATCGVLLAVGVRHFWKECDRYGVESEDARIRRVTARTFAAVLLFSIVTFAVRIVGRFASGE